MQNRTVVDVREQLVDTPPITPLTEALGLAHLAADLGRLDWAATLSAHADRIALHGGDRTSTGGTR